MATLVYPPPACKQLLAYTEGVLTVRGPWGFGGGWVLTGADKLKEEARKREQERIEMLSQPAMPPTR